MSELVAAVAEKLGGVPEELVMRSASARAAAQGVSADDVLTAWAGGAAVAPSAAPPVEAAPLEAVEEIEPESPAPPAAPAAAAVTAAPEPQIPPAAAAVMVEAAPEPEVEPAGLGDRLRLGVGVGAVMGAVLGVIGMVLASPLMVGRADVVSDSNESAIAVTTVATVVTIAVASAVFGAIIAIIARAVPRFIGRSYDVRGSATVAAVIGGIAGLILGFAAGGILVATGEEALDGGVLLSVRSGLFVVVLGGTVLGAITGGIAQLLGTSSVYEDDSETEVRNRISNAVMVPALAAIAILGFVVPLGVLLVSFHEFAPVIAMAVAALILTFSFLMASRPNLRITRGEFLLAAAGVGVALILIAAIASQLGSDEHGDGDHAGARSALTLQLF